MTLTELSDGWYRYDEPGGDIKIRSTDGGYEFGDGTAIVDHLAYEGRNGDGIGGLMARAVMELEDISQG